MTRPTPTIDAIGETATVRSFTVFCYVAVLFGSFLLFEVELILGKFLLPWFGGVPATWITCLFFFQVALLFGYSYAHLLSGAALRKQAGIHQGVLALSIALLALGSAWWRTPITPGIAWKPYVMTHPTWQVIKLLGVSIGIPFLVLAATAPLLQSWFARLHPSKPAYPLYALSNLGSLLALLAYPLIIEPNLTLRAQAWTWSAVYVLFAAACGMCAWISGHSALKSERRQYGAAEPVSAFTRIFWIGLAACGSAMLLAVTNVICLEIAGFPLLWVLPLAVYLLSFIACFARHSLYRRWIFHPLFAMAAILTLVLGHRPTTWDILAYLLLLFAVCMVCHGELVLLKPPSSQLTSFYLSLAAGGALGSLCVSVLAPHLFTELWELPIAEILAAVLVIVILFRDRQSWFYTSPAWMPVLLVWGVVIYNRLMVSIYKAAPAWNNYNFLTIATCAIVSLILLRHRRNAPPYFPWLRPAPFFALALVGVLTFHAITQVIAFARTSTYRSRNFFGILHVSTDGKVLNLLHGRTSHGTQIIDPRFRDLPTSYYLPDSGIGSLLLEERQRLPGKLRVGVVGLGTGTLAAYGRQGDYYRFYEINPAVYALSSGPSPTFTFLKDSPARIDVEIGDARLRLESEANRGQLQGFDVLVLDAFNSDSIPVHLLTREAVELYLKHLKPDGVLAFHISNRSLNLAPVIAGIAKTFNLESALVQFTSQKSQSSTWVLLSRDRAVLELPLIRERARYGMDTAHDEYWTDDYGNLLHLIIWHK